MKNGLKVGLLVLTALIFDACSFKSANQSGSAGGTPVVGVRNFQQVYANMLEVTNLAANPSDSTMSPVISQYNSISTSFSTNGDASVTAPMAMAALQLAEPIMAAAITKNTLNLPMGMNPSTPGNTSSAIASAAQQAALVQALTMQLWGRLPSSTEQNILVTLAANLISEAASQTPSNATLKQVIIGLGVAILASPKSYTNVVVTAAN